MAMNEYPIDLCVDNAWVSTSSQQRLQQAPDSSCVAWLNDGLGRCECWSGVKYTVDDLTGMQQQQQSVCGPTARRMCSHACTKA